MNGSTPSADKADDISKKRFALLTGVLGGMTAIGSISIDASLPAMPVIAEGLGAELSTVQFTLSAFIFGVATGQLVQGPLSDRFGRRPVVLIGMAIYALMALSCALSSSIEMLIASRYFQGVAGAAGTIVARAIVRDLFDRSQGAKLMSYVLSVMALAPVLGPLIGGLLVYLFDWPAVFLFMAAFGTLIWFLVFRHIGETLPRRDPAALRPLRMLLSFREIVTHRAFLSYLACLLCGYCGLFTYLSGAPAVMIDFLGYTPAEFGWIFPITFSGQFITHAVGGRLVGRMGIDRLLFLGTCVCCTGGLLLAGLAWAGIDHAAAIVGPMFMFMTGFGFIFPMGTTAIMSPFPHIAGVASSFLGFIQFASASVVVAFVGFIYDGTQIPMTTMIALLGIGTVVSYFLFVTRLPEEFRHRGRVHH